MRQGGDFIVGELRGCEPRAPIQAGDIRREELRGAPTVVEDFDADLAAVGVACERKLDA